MRGLLYDFRANAALIAWMGSVLLSRLAAAQGQDVSWVPPFWEQDLPVKIARIDAEIVNDLQRVQSRIEEQDWREAAQLLRELRDRSGSLLLIHQRSPAGWSHLIPLRKWLDQQRRHATQQHPELLVAHRSLVDPVARQLWQRGSPTAWEAIVRDFPGSSDADKAAAALADLALERAAFRTARQWWRHYLQELRHVEGTAGWTAEPLPEFALAHAQLVLVSILQGDRHRAERELQQYSDRFPAATGTIAGRSGSLAEILHELWNDPQTWPAAGQPPSTGGLSLQTQTDPPACRERWRFSLKGLLAVAQQRASEISPAGPFQPYVIGERVILHDSFQVLGLDVRTGRPAEGTDRWGLVFRDPDLEPRYRRGQTPPLGVAQFGLAVDHGLVLARMGCVPSIVASGEHAPSQIIGWDVSSWKAVLRMEAPDDWIFEGTPITDGVRVFSCLRKRVDQSPLHVAAFDRSTGHLLWQRFVSAGETSGRGLIDEIHHASIDLQEELLICCTQGGLLAAFDLDGHPDWMTIYPRQQDHPESGQGITSRVYEHGLLFCAPPDHHGIFCLDTLTGTVQWTSHVPQPQWRYLLGTTADHLIVGGRDLWWLDKRSGQFAFQVKLQGQEPGSGRGCLAGDVVIWPTTGPRPQLHFRATRDGNQLREPLLLDDASLRPGTVSTSGDLILFCSDEQIMAWDCHSPPTEAEADE